MAAVVAEVGVSAMMACTSRPLQIGAICSSCSQVCAMSPLYTSFSGVALPTSRGLKSSSRRLPTAVRASQKKGMMREDQKKGIMRDEAETAGSTRLERGVAGPVSDKTFDDLVLKAEGLVLVDFWAPWCGPCRMIAPIIDELAKTYAGKLRCFKLNTDESPYIATEYGIRSIPTVMFFKNGEKKDTVIGAVPKNTLVGTVEKYL